MNKRIFAIVILLIILLSYTAVTVNAVYNLELKNGKWFAANITDSNGNKMYADGGTGAFITKYKAAIVFVGGLGTISMVAAALYNVGRLNLTMSNPMQRQQCIRGIMICGLFAALLGSSTLFVGLFYGLFR